MHHRRPYRQPQGHHIQHSTPPLYPLLLVPEVSKHVNLLPKCSVSHLLLRLVLVCTRPLEDLHLDLLDHLKAWRPPRGLHLRLTTKVLHGRQLLANSDLLKCTELLQVKRLPQDHMLGPHRPLAIVDHQGPQGLTFVLLHPQCPSNTFSNSSKDLTVHQLLLSPDPTVLHQECRGQPLQHNRPRGYRGDPQELPPMHRHPVFKGVLLHQNIVSHRLNCTRLGIDLFFSSWRSKPHTGLLPTSFHDNI
jgi:hypothetical protein